MLNKINFFVTIAMLIFIILGFLGYSNIDKFKNIKFELTMTKNKKIYINEKLKYLTVFHVKNTLNKPIRFNNNNENRSTYIDFDKNIDIHIITTVEIYLKSIYFIAKANCIDIAVNDKVKLNSRQNDNWIVIVTLFIVLIFVLFLLNKNKSMLLQSEKECIKIKNNMKELSKIWKITIIY